MSALRAYTVQENHSMMKSEIEKVVAMVSEAKAAAMAIRAELSPGIITLEHGVIRCQNGLDENSSTSGVGVAELEAR